METTRRLTKAKRKFPLEKSATVDFLRAVFCFEAEVKSNAAAAAAVACNNNSKETQQQVEPNQKQNYVDEGSASSSGPSSPTAVCGICLEDVTKTEKRFGLLSCDHCFCLNCVMKWRRTTTTSSSSSPSSSNTTKQQRTCPTCRKKSEFVVPSDAFCVGVEKERIVSSYMSHLSYKSHVSTIPCKRFNCWEFGGSCPFGHECFYAHYDSHGHDMKRHDNIPLIYSKMYAYERYIRDSLYCGDDEDEDSFLDDDPSNSPENEDAEFFAILEHEKIMLNTFASKTKYC